MKKIYLLTLLSIFSLNLYCQINWIEHPEPIFDVGPEGSWDDRGVATPWVLHINDTLHMWYAGVSIISDLMSIGHATSTDGFTWDKDTLNPVLTGGGEGSWDKGNVYVPNVLFLDTIYYMWYNGNDGGGERICLATSPDGRYWTKHPENPVLDVGESGSWDSKSTGPGSVSYDTAFHFWYTGAEGEFLKMGYATSQDGIHWTKHPDNPVLESESAEDWDYPRTQNMAIVHENSMFHGWYSGGEILKWDIGYVSSTDGVNWAKYGNKPVFEKGASGSWDGGGVGFNTVLYDEATFTFRMWFSGAQSEYKWKIGYAESDARLPALWVKSKTIIDTTDIDTDTLVAEIHKDGIIYIVPEGTSPVNDSIVKYKLASVEATANTEVHIPLADFSLGKYTVVAVSNQEFVSPNPQLLWVVDDDTPPVLTVADTVEIGDTIRVTSTKEGILYLLRFSIDPDLSLIRNPINLIDSSEVNANDPAEFLTSDLYEFYNYYLYAVDIYGLFSEQNSVYLKDIENRTEEISKSGIRIYPNPAQNLLTIETDQSGQHTIEITSLNGQLLYSTVMKGTSQRIDLSSFHKGVYFITVRSRDYVRTEKIIKL